MASNAIEVSGAHPPRSPSPRIGCSRQAHRPRHVATTGHTPTEVDSSIFDPTPSPSLTPLASPSLSSSSSSSSSIQITPPQSPQRSTGLLFSTSLSALGSGLGATPPMAALQEPRDATEPPVPTSLAEISIGSTLGEGSYAVVKEAFSHGRTYALKILEKKSIRTQDDANAVLREKEALSAFCHQNVVKLYLATMTDKALYFLLEHCANGELFEHIKHVTRFSDETARFYAAEILEGLEYIHSKGFVHRDLKPENILLDANWHVKITDFGTAKRIGTTADHKTMVRSTFVGTSHYLSPEILNDDQVSPASDLWALGCIIYQMLVGKPPFSGPTDYVIFRQIRENNVQYPGHVSESARMLITQLLNPDSSLRPTPDQIRRHPWFRDFSFVDLGSQQPPPIVAPIDLALEAPPPSPEPARAQQFALFGAVPHAARSTSGPSPQVAPVEPSSPPSSHRGPSTSAPPTLYNSLARPQSLTTEEVDQAAPWEKYLREGELVAFRGIVEKRTGLVFRVRHLFLVASPLSPRLFYLDPAVGTMKGEFYLTPDVEVRLHPRKETHFKIITPGRVFNLNALSGSAKEWQNHIYLLSEHSKRISSTWRDTSFNSSSGETADM